MKSFTDLEAWSVAMKLAKEIHIVTKLFPSDEKFGLISQVRRSSTSILANLAEGFGRYTYLDKAHKYTIARGETAETKAHILIAAEFGYISRENADQIILLTDQVGRLLSGLIYASKTRS